MAWMPAAVAAISAASRCGAPPPASSSSRLLVLGRRRGGPRGVYGRVLGGCRRAHRVFARRPSGVRPRVAVGGDGARRGVAERGNAARWPRGPLTSTTPCSEAARPAVAPARRRLRRVDARAARQASALLKAPQRDARRPRGRPVRLLLLGDGTDALQPRACAARRVQARGGAYAAADGAVPPSATVRIQVFSRYARI